MLHARLTILQVNAARCYGHLQAWWLFAHVAFSALALLPIQHFFSSFWLFGYFLLHLCALLFVQWKYRRQMETDGEGLIRLEAALGLHNRLSLALANLQPWPPPHKIPPFWCWSRSLILSLVCPPAVFFLVLLLPRPTPAASPPRSQLVPSTWQDLQISLDALNATGLFSSTALAEWQERLDRLTQQNETGWLSQTSLEAYQHLRDKLQSALTAQAKELSQASNLLSQVASVNSIEDSAADSFPVPEMDQILSSLADGPLPLDAVTLQELDSLLQPGARMLAPQQWQKMRDRLQAAEEAIRNSPIIDAQTLVPSALASSAPLQSGSSSRGPGTAPILWQQSTTSPQLERSAPLPSSDSQQATLGDVLEIRRRPGNERAEAETIEPGFQGGYGGSESSPIQQQPATPEERRILQRYFSL